MEGDDRRSVEPYEDDEEGLVLRSSDLRFDPVSVVHERSYFDPVSVCVRLSVFVSVFTAYLVHVNTWASVPGLGSTGLTTQAYVCVIRNCKSVVFLISPASTFPPPHKHRTLMKAKMRSVTSTLTKDNRTTD